jgi:hypothetical protein
MAPRCAMSSTPENNWFPAPAGACAYRSRASGYRGTGSDDEMDWNEIPEHPVLFPRPRALSWPHGPLHAGELLGLPLYKLGSNCRIRRLARDSGSISVKWDCRGVWINGEKAGERAWRPFRFDITRQSKTGGTRSAYGCEFQCGMAGARDTIFPREVGPKVPNRTRSHPVHAPQRTRRTGPNSGSAPVGGIDEVCSQRRFQPHTALTGVPAPCHQ